MGGGYGLPAEDLAGLRLHCAVFGCGGAYGVWPGDGLRSAADQSEGWRSGRGGVYGGEQLLPGGLPGPVDR